MWPEGSRCDLFAISPTNGQTIIRGFVVEVHSQYIHPLNDNDHTSGKLYTTLKHFQFLNTKNRKIHTENLLTKLLIRDTFGFHTAPLAMATYFDHNKPNSYTLRL